MSEQPYCWHCGCMPAKFTLKYEGNTRRICGVCVHRHAILMDMLDRIRYWRMKQKMEQMEAEVEQEERTAA